VLAPSASWFACLALSAFCLTAVPSCSIDAVVSSSADACFSVRADRSRLPCAIWVDAVAMLSLPARTWATIFARFSHIRVIAAMTLDTSPGATGMRAVKSPRATACAIAAASAGSPPTADQIDLRAHHPNVSSARADSAKTDSCTQLRFVWVALSEAIAASANAVETLTVSSTPARCSR
jgi:hypothetical protein